MGGLRVRWLAHVWSFYGVIPSPGRARAWSGIDLQSVMRDIDPIRSPGRQAGPRRTLRPLSCYHAVDVSRLTTPAKFFDKVATRQKSRRCITRADCVPVSCSRYAGSLLMARAPESIDAIIRSHLGLGPEGLTMTGSFACLIVLVVIGG